MSMIKARDIRQGDVMRPKESAHALGNARAAMVWDDESGTRWIRWAWGVEMHFAMNDANYPADRNPEFHVLNR